MNQLIGKNAIECLRYRTEIDKHFQDCVDDLMYALPEERDELYLKAWGLAVLYFGELIDSAKLDRHILETEI